MGCKIQSAGFSSWVRYLAGLFTKTGNRIVKTAGRNPMFIAPYVVNFYLLSTEYSKNLFTIIIMDYKAAGEKLPRIYALTIFPENFSGK